MSATVHILFKNLSQTCVGGAVPVLLTAVPTLFGSIYLGTNFFRCKERDPNKREIAENHRKPSPKRGKEENVACLQYRKIDLMIQG
ncbi:hypothetical protein L596_010820 [Steinernema carpocapsae]|uniref:Uncharacterized protein n=1 Tax=Steinernema carpocapsae TaxID=34508 RepID=A0A4V6XWN9_STECR|nr:hypothetical protein L596_010820 [Steinernema carpocapsae]